MSLLTTSMPSTREVVSGSELVTDMTRARRRLYIAGAVMFTLIVAAWHSGIELSRMFTGRGVGDAGSLLAAFFHPDLSGPFVSRVARLALDSFLIGALGTALALVVGIGLALAAARHPRLEDGPADNVIRRRVLAGLRQLSRGILAVFRSIPEIIWAYLFVRIFGLGAGAAVMAIAITFGGILGKLFAELLEAVDPRPAQQLRAAGAGAIACFLYGTFPLVRSQWVGYALFRLECGIRSASILGIVGAGGLGLQIHLSVKYLQFDQLATALLAVLLYVIALELVSAKLRRMPSRFSGLFFAATAGAALVVLDVPWGDLFTSGALRQAKAFFAGFANPNLDGGFVWAAIKLSAVTVAIAAVATAMAALIACVLAPAAARTFAGRGFLEHPPGRRPMWIVQWGVMHTVRLVLQAFRALPELIWALIFVIWVGPGPTAGVLAICAHTIGILGRLYGEVLEEAEPAVPRALEAAGSSKTSWFLFGTLPQVAPRLLSYTLFRFEVNIRATAMVGFVGAGGLGDALDTALELFHMRDLATLLIVLLATVLIVDVIGDRVRSRLLSAHQR